MGMRTAPSSTTYAAALGVAVLLFASATAQGPVRTFGGATAAEFAGRSVAVVGDVDSDFLADVALGVPGESTNGAAAGAVRVYSVSSGALKFGRLGEAAGDAFGAAVAAAGDANGDGVPDVIVGAPGDDDNGAGSGSAWILSGVDGSVLQRFDGDAAGDAFGSAVTGLGDVDGDGYDDVAVGAPGGDSVNGGDSGWVRLFSGFDGSVLRTVDGDAGGDAFGSSVSGTGDLDGDAAGDLIAGAPMDDTGAGADAGSARAVSGATGGQLFNVEGQAAGDALGQSVAGVGDANGDGTPDVLLGAPGHDLAGAEAGTAMLCSGVDGSSLRQLYGAAAGDGFGRTVARVGDVDADGKADLGISFPGSDRAGPNAGGAMVYAESGLPIYTFLGREGGEEGGAGLAGGADVDGDGYPDVIVGRPGSDLGGNNAGGADVYARRPFDGVAYDRTLTSGIVGARFGLGLVGIDDINNDNVPDYVVGAPFEDPNREGTVRVYSGADHTVIHTWRGPPQPDTWFGNILNPVGDIDGDGVTDIGVGAWHWDEAGLADTGYAEIFSGASGLSIRSFKGAKFRSHMGSSLGGCGDVTGDGVDDFFIGQGLINGEVGTLWIYSGASRTVVRELNGALAGEWFGWSAEPVGDLNGDGASELVVGAPSGSIGAGFATLIDPATGARLATWVGDNANDVFGFEVGAPGDVNGDGVPDIMVGAHQADPNGLLDAGLVRIFSGADYTLIHEVQGDSPSQMFGNFISGAGDVNGDGYDDFLVGAPTAFGGPPTIFLSGRVTLFSGFDASELARVEGTAVQDQMRICAGIGDINADGLGDFAVAADMAPNATMDGRVEIYVSSVGSDPGAFVLYGPSCPGSGGLLPRAGFVGRPRVGQVFTNLLRTAPASSPAFWLLGSAPTALDLGVIGAPGCLSNTLPAQTLPTLTDPVGSATLPVPVPNNAVFIGAQVYVQWAAQDVVNPLNLITTNGGRVTLGR